VSHSLSHRDLPTLSDSEMHRELRDSKAWIQRNGFGPSDVFVVPYHSWGTRERAAIDQYYTRARGFTVNQFVPERFADYPVTQPLDLTGYESEFAPFTTAEGRAKTIAYVKRAVDEGYFIDLFFHQISDAQLPAFKQLMAELVKYKANLRTWGEFSAAPTP
jgi:peptidoglycan/xylan/chitin deacetylase (PgdA/CDA1 family)